MTVNVITVKLRGVFMKIYNNILETIGSTPLVKINKLIKGNLFVKLEYFNPAGSVKDRAALNMINKAKERGLINKDTEIIEPTSGNTGIGLALVCAVEGYRLTIVMPDNMSIERQMLMKAYGANIVLTEGKLGMKGAIDKAIELSKNNSNSFIPQQFENPDNLAVHYLTTAEEIWTDTDGKIDIFVAGIGTGGTITGVSKKLKEYNSNIKVVGVEPSSSPYLSEGKAGMHKIQGIGAGFKPSILDMSLIDKIIAVDDEEAISMTKNLAKKEGILAGISSGAAVCAAISELSNNSEKNVVVLLPDNGERYLSGGIF